MRVAPCAYKKHTIFSRVCVRNVLNSYNLLWLGRSLDQRIFPLELVDDCLFGSFRSSTLGHKGVKVSGHDKSEDDDAKTNETDDESENHQGVISQSVELGESEREDDRENGAANVSKEEWHERGDLPVLSSADDQVEVTTQLVTLEYQC